MTIVEAKCNRCGSTNWTNAGLAWRKGVKDIQRRRCHDCGKIFILPDGHPYSRVNRVKEITKLGVK